LNKKCEQLCLFISKVGTVRLGRICKWAKSNPAETVSWQSQPGIHISMMTMKVPNATNFMI